MFAYSQLRRFFEELRAHSDVFSFAGAVDACRVGTPRTTIMRHDVDIDVDAAMAMSEVEEEYGVQSTFFFLIGCETYNVSTASNRRDLRRLVERGFEVGLHFDPLVYAELTEEAAIAAADKEARWLADITGQPVRSISVHNPSVHGSFPRFEGYINAYEPAFFSPSRYLSDSCMGFRGKDPLEFVRRAEQGCVQILLHPFHYSETGGGYPDCYAAFLKRFVARIDQTMRVNPTYVREMEGRSLLGARE